MIVWCGTCEVRTVPYDPNTNGDMDITAQRPPCVVCAIKADINRYLPGSPQAYAMAAIARRNGIGVPHIENHFVRSTLEYRPSGTYAVECTCGVASFGTSLSGALRDHTKHRGLDRRLLPVDRRLVELWAEAGRRNARQARGSQAERDGTLGSDHEHITRIDEVLSSGADWLRARGFIVATCARGCGLPVAGKGDVCNTRGCDA